MLFQVDVNVIPWDAMPGLIQMHPDDFIQSVRHIVNHVQGLATKESEKIQFFQPREEESSIEQQGLVPSSNFNNNSKSYRSRKIANYLGQSSPLLLTLL